MYHRKIFAGIKKTLKKEGYSKRLKKRFVRLLALKHGILVQTLTYSIRQTKLNYFRMEANGLKILSALAFRKLKDKHPTVPEFAIPKTKYTDKSANGLTQCIIHFIELMGGQAERINNTGRQIDNRKTVKDVLGSTRTIGSVKWIKGTGTNGTSDISATIYGKSVKVEVKIGADRQSDQQKEYQQTIERAGGIYFVAKNFKSFYEWYNLTFEKL